MPFDGVVVKAVAAELSTLLDGARVEKIYQPEQDEVVLNIRAKSRSFKLLLSANANYPRVHITGDSKENPASPPMFCMMLRKHISGGKITSVGFYDFERMISFGIESANELGDISEKKLIIEIMGRYSNIILVNSEGRIIDAAKHVDSRISSVREVMPAREYMLPPPQDKMSPESLDIEAFASQIPLQGNMTLEKHLLKSIKGFSPLLCREVCFMARLAPNNACSFLSPSEACAVGEALREIVSDIKGLSFFPCLVMESGSEIPLDFHCLNIKQFAVKQMPSISEVIDAFYSSRDRSERLKQKRSDVHKLLMNCLDRCKKKIEIQQDTLREAADFEKYRLYGELITANIYSIPAGSESALLTNYYAEDCSKLEVELDVNLTPQQNAQKYFKHYTKGKNTSLSTNRQLEESLKELEYLESVMQLLENCTAIQEIDEVRQELMEQGYLSARHRNANKKAKPTKPFHFRSSDGFDILVGKNNHQNDQLTLKLALSGDIWLHTRNIPGSHVIIRKLQKPVSDTALLEAAMIAAYHSKARPSSGVPVDYTAVRNVKKPSGAKPGKVIYNDFKTIIVTPDEATVKRLKVED